MEKIFEIEEKYPAVNDIQIHQHSIWPVYRMIFRYQLLLSQNLAAKNQKPGFPSYFRNFLRDLILLIPELARFIKDYSKWTSPYDYVVFSNDLERKQLGDSVIDKLATGLIGKLGEDRTLLINYPSHPRKHFGNFRPKGVVNGNIITLLSRIGIRTPKLSHADRSIIDTIAHEYKLQDDGVHDLAFTLNKVKVLDYLISKWKPKAVFVCCYSYYAECYTANRRGINTVELQHGFMGPLHPGYESKLKLERSYFAKHFLTYGENSIKGLRSNIVNLRQVKTIGNFFIEKLSSAPTDKKILDLLGGFKVSICVPTDFITENELVDFILPVAHHNPDYVFLLVPRLQMSNGVLLKIGETRNIKVVVDFDFQNVVRHCTFHACTISTCCLEALSLGVPNILINVDGRAYEMYRDILDPAYSKFVTSSYEFIEAADTMGGCSKQDIMNSNQKNFANHFENNLNHALSEILNIPE